MEKKKVPVVLISLLTSAILVACGPSQVERDAQATAIVADIFATQTAEAPTPTPTVTHTPTRTPTPTATNTPTRTPTLTFTPTLVPPTDVPLGTITGKVTYADLSNINSAKPMQDVMVLLCRVPAEGLPFGPTVASINRDETEDICTLQGTPTALTDSEGVFTLDGVPSATYLVLFHLFPDEMEGVEWDGVALMEAYLSEVTGEIPPSGESGFWEDGVFGSLEKITMSWNPTINKNFEYSLNMGTVCSRKFGFCSSIRDEHPSPVTEVESNETVEIELTTYFEREE